MNKELYHFWYSNKQYWTYSNVRLCYIQGQLLDYTESKPVAHLKENNLPIEPSSKFDDMVYLGIGVIA